MIRKQTWILLAVFVVLLGGAYYITKNPLPKSVETTPTPTLVPAMLSGWQSSDLTAVNIKDSAGTVLQLSKDSSGNWQLNGKDPVEGGRIEQISSELFAFTPTGTLEPGYALEVLGLNAPTQTLTLTTNQAKKTEIKIGKLTPTESGYYVQVDNNAPVVISKGAVDSLFNLTSQAALLNWTPTPEPSPTSEVNGTPEPTLQVTPAQ